MKIFISYRRVDTEAIAKSIAAFLSNRGHDCFIDINSINPGEEFRQEIENFILDCDAVLALIGSAWLSAPNEFGTPRLNDDSDLLRLELELALVNGIPVVPVLTKETAALKVEHVPPGLKRLPGIQAYRLSQSDVITGDEVTELLQFILNKIGKRESERSKQKETPHFVLSVGGGNGEHILSLDEQLQRGRKHPVDSETLYGGSGFNYASKLLGYGIPVAPLLNIGTDDLGREIRNQFLRSAADSEMAPPLIDWARLPEFFVPHAKTARSTIIVEDGERTILKEQVPLGEFYLDHLKSQVEKLRSMGLFDGIKAVMIGHIEADRASACAGACTKYLIEQFQGHCPIFANPGGSQLELGYDAWKDHIDGLTVLQMNFDEVKRFFRGQETCNTLSDMLNQLCNHSAYSVITLDKFGALCVGQKSRQFILAWPHDVEVIDSTGAGDAFMSGAVAHLFKNKEAVRSIAQMSEAIDEARYWAARACRHLGGAKECPSAAEIDLFKSYLKESLGVSDPPEIQNLDDGKRIIWVLDRAYGG